MFSNNFCKDHCVNCNKTKDFVDTNLCAPESAAGIPTPILLISVSNPEITFNDYDARSNASGREFKIIGSYKKIIYSFTFHISTLQNKQMRS